LARRKIVLDEIGIHADLRESALVVAFAEKPARIFDTRRPQDEKTRKRRGDDLDGLH
jgi:hypothetical protein